MTRIARWIGAVTVMAVFAAPVFADTLVLKNGTKVTGYFEGGSARVVKFRGPDGNTRDYDILQVQEVVFDAGATSSPTPAAATPPSTTPQLRPASERPPAQPPSSTAANTGWTV